MSISRENLSIANNYDENDKDDKNKKENSNSKKVKNKNENVKDDKNKKEDSNSKKVKNNDGINRDPEIELQFGKFRVRWEMIKKFDLDKEELLLIDDYIQRATILEQDLTKAFNASNIKKHVLWLKTLLEQVIDWLSKARKKVAEANTKANANAGGGGGGGWGKGGQSKCSFCDGPHWMSRCPLPVAEKKKAVKERDLCLHCGTLKHKTAYCSKQNCLKCFICGGPHYGCLHEVVS